MDLTKLLHDGANLCRGILGSGPRRLESPPAEVLIEKRAFQEAGEVAYANAFEHAFDAEEPVETGYAYPEAPLYHLRDVYLVGEEAHLFSVKGENLSLCTVCARIPDRKIRRPIKSLARRIEEPVIHLCGPNAENHGHFILDYLPKMVAYREIFARVPEAKILLPRGRKKWKLRYLARFGVSEDRVIEQGGGTVHAREVYYVPIPSTDGHLGAPEIHLAVRDALEKGIEPHREARPLFVVRMGEAPNKRALNEEELIAMTREVFPEVLPMRLSRCGLEEQIARFKAAPVVIGCIGQGLTPVLFSREARLLVVCHGSKKLTNKARSWSRAYCHIAEMAGNEAFQLKTSTPRDANQDYVVDTKGYRRALEFLKRGRW